jgi:hypothetical protein
METQAIDFDQMPDFEEEYSQDDVQDASSGGQLPAGKYRCTVADIQGKQLNHMTPPCLGLNLQLKITKVISVGGAPASAEMNEQLMGRKTYDDIAMPKAGEKDWVRNRRINIAAAFGLIPESGGRVTKQMWFSLVGQEIVINLEEGKKRDKETGKLVPSGYMNVKLFGGYEPLGSGDNGTAGEPQISPDDI